MLNYFIVFMKYQCNNFYLQYGPKGVFYKLKSSCLKKKSDHYEYTLCLFDSVKQQAFPAASTLIGSQPHWVSQGGEAGFVLEMSQGSAINCPDGRSRHTLVSLRDLLKGKLQNIIDN